MNTTSSDWRKSTRSSDPDLAQCVEVAVLTGARTA